MGGLPGEDDMVEAFLRAKSSVELSGFTISNEFQLTMISLFRNGSTSQDAIDYLNVKYKEWYQGETHV
jgi:hypothetical protein